MMERLNNRQVPAHGRAALTVFDALLEAIVAGQLRPGDALSELSLAEQFGVSRTPVREALHRLEQIKLAERGARRAFVVREIRSEELEELFEAVGEVEAALAGLAAHRMSDQERWMLQGIVQEGMISGEDPGVYAQINTRFHDAIKAGARNAVLAATSSELNVRTLPWRLVNFYEDPERIDASRTEHQEIAKAIAAADADETHRLMRSHMASSRAVAAGLLARRSR
ncbi:GntR family transcriptional regulator [Jiella sp. M17.18]|uniref:GntR family transcriptional regulator n=1 Tax=Jiella sp. M17.18 TaxID=3234247 RepID=UPI0034DEB250